MSDFFQKLADKISIILTTWQNFMIWVVLVVVWIALGPYLQNHDFLPGWFISNGFNFPLNTVTTLAELYIGFLLGINSARIQKEQDRHSEMMKEEITHMKNELDELVEHIRNESNRNSKA